MFMLSECKACQTLINSYPNDIIENFIHRAVDKSRPDLPGCVNSKKVKKMKRLNSLLFLMQ
jgi:hypothetical protein